MTRFRLLRNQLLVAVAALLLVTCTDNPTGPTVGGTVHLSVSPRFKAGVVLSSALPIDEARLIVYRQLSCDCSPDSVAGATAPFALTQDSIRMQLSFTLQQSPETLEVHFDLLGAGQTLFSGDTSVIIQAGVAAQVPPLSVYYNGPGYDIAFLNIFPRDTVLTFGDSLQFGAAGSNAVEQPETAFYLSWSSSQATARIRPDGMIHAPSQRLSAWIKGQAPNGLADSTTITFVPKPVALAKVSGDTQTASISAVLPLPLRVRVNAADSLGVAGVRLVFHPLGVAGPVVPDTVYTDSLGFAQVIATLGDSIGTQQWQVTGTGLPSVTFTATAQLLAGPPFRVRLVTPPTDTQVNGALVTPAPVVQIEDSAGIAVHDSGVGITATTYTYLVGAPKLTRALRTGARRAPNGGPYLNAGAFGVTRVTTDAQGRATFSGLRLSGYATDRIVFNTDSFNLVADTTVPLFVKAGAPKNLQKGSTDSTSSFVDSLMTSPPAVYVYDTTYNPVPNAAVIFQVTAGGGKLAGAADSVTVFTDSSGYAAVSSWKLGPIPGTNNVEATVAGAGSLTFTAFAQPPVPTVLLQLQGTSVIGVGRTATLQVRLSAPAGAGGDSVLVSSDNSGIVSVAGPGIFVPTGDSIGTIVLNGVAAGADTIRATAIGYIAGALGVTASVNLISLPATLNVPFGGTASLAVSLGQPAPAGGVVVTLTSSDTSLVGLVTPTVTIPQGATNASATLSGKALGTVTVTAANPNYSPFQSTVSTTATLNIINASHTVYSTQPVPETLEFRSAGALIAAPSGGIIATLTAVDSGCVSVPASDTIPAGLSSTTFTPTWAGVTALPCTTKVYATAAGVGPDSLSITINPQPGMTMYPSDVGSGLGVSAYTYLQTGVATARNAIVRSLDTSRVLVAAVDTAIGGDTIVVPLAFNGTYIPFYVRGQEGIVSDSAQIQVDVPGFTSGTAWVHVRKAGVRFYNYTTSTTTLTAPTLITAEIGLPYAANNGIQSVQAVRPGGTAVTVTFAITPSSVATLTDSTAVHDTIRTAIIKPGQYLTPSSLATGGVYYAPAGAGTSTMLVSAAGLVAVPTDSVTTTVTAPTISMYQADVGSGLATSDYSYLQTGTPTATTVSVRSLDTTKVLVAAADTAIGSDSVGIPLVANGTYVPYFLRGREGIVNDSTQIQVSAPGYVTSTMWVRVRRPGIKFYNAPTNTTTLSAPSLVTAEIGLPYTGNTGLQSVQAVRPGGTPMTVTFTVTPSSVATLTDSSAVQDTVRTAVLKPGQYITPSTLVTGSVQYVPLGAGTSSLIASAAGVVNLPGDTITTTVTAPTITLYGNDVGSGLATSAAAYLQTGVPTARTAIIRSLDSTKVRVATADTAVGADTAAFALPLNGSSFSYYIRGMEGIVNDSAQVQIDVPGYTSSTVWIRVRQPGIQLTAMPTTATTSSDSITIYSSIGLPNSGKTGMQAAQVIRPGGTTAVPIFRVSTPSVGRLATLGGLADSSVGSIVAGNYQSQVGLSVGGQAFKALTTGLDTVTVTAAGFVALPQATVGVMVSTPGITLYPPTSGVASGLQMNGSFYLGASRHGGVNVVVKSSQPSVMLVSPDATTTGSDSIVIFIPDGQTYGTYYVQGVDSTVGTPILTVSAPGFVDQTAGISVMQPGIQVYNVPSTMSSTAADQPIWAYIGVPNVGNTQITQYESRRAGAPDLVVTFNASDPTAATLINSGGTGTPLTATIKAGYYYSPSSVAGGGVAIHPVAPGTSTISVSAPGMTPQTNASATVTVQ
ncbi:MAG TPA: hypothetical protein VFI39_01615 [Gemmatimonadales bacterium]|nr:hypothetical protein [Gemmatimonadales bacterium]